MGERRNSHSRATVPKCMRIGDLGIAFRRKVEEGDDDEEIEVRVRCVELRGKMVLPVLVHHPPWHICRARRRLVHPRLFGLQHFANHIFSLLAQPLQPNCKLSLLLDQKQHNLLHLHTHTRAHTTKNKQNLTWLDVRLPGFDKLRHCNSRELVKLATQG